MAAEAASADMGLRRGVTTALCSFSGELVGFVPVAYEAAVVVLREASVGRRTKLCDGVR